MNKLKQLLKGKKGAKTPRPLDEIKNQYSDVARHAGNLQYEIKVKQADLDNVNRLLLELNQEAGARQQLDAEAAKAMKEKEAKNEQPK